MNCGIEVKVPLGRFIRDVVALDRAANYQVLLALPVIEREAS